MGDGMVSFWRVTESSNKVGRVDPSNTETVRWVGVSCCSVRRGDAKSILTLLATPATRICSARRERVSFYKNNKVILYRIFKRRGHKRVGYLSALRGLQGLQAGVFKCLYFWGLRRRGILNPGSGF